MKKIIITTLITTLIAVTINGCGKHTYTVDNSKLAEFNCIYRDTSDKDIDGSYPVLNVTDIDTHINNIIIKIGAPTMKQIYHAFDNFLFVQVLNKDGNVIPYKKISLKHIGNENVEATLTITDVENIKDAKYILIGPYKDKDNKQLFFEIQK